MNDEDREETVPENESLNALDRRLRRDRLVRQIRELGGIVGGLQDEPTEVELEFFEHILAWEIGPRSSHRIWLARAGEEFIPPAELDDASLEGELWRLIRALAVARVFFYHTDHLTDRELYEWIWCEVLPAECPDGARTEADANHWDLADSGSGDAGIWLRYYASKTERREWQREFPDNALPPHVARIRRRDHRLPERRET